METTVRLPQKLDFLFHPYRYKVARGGRGGAKSWSFARALLTLGASKPLRILCTREVQKSIKDSVHKLLCDQIQSLNLGQFYEPLKDQLRGINGTEFIFAGLSDHTVESIKSYEGVDIVWVEEGQAVSKRSFDILIPTIRKPGSEIWVSFNPELDTDDVWRRFIENPPPNSRIVEINYGDNPWFSAELEAERLHCQKADPENYPNIWEGKPRAAVAGAIYATEVTKLQEDGRARDVPYDPMLKVHVVCDLGFNDAMAIILVQRVASEIRVIDYIEDSHRTLDSYSAELRKKRLNWGKLWLPHDARQKTLAADGQTTEDKFKKLGWTTQLVPDISVEGGIRTGRMAFGRMYIDKGKAGRLLECLKRYRRNIPTTTNEPTTPVHDEYSHGADAYRYMSIVADDMRNENQEAFKPIKYSTRGIV